MPGRDCPRQDPRSARRGRVAEPASRAGDRSVRTAMFEIIAPAIAAGKPLAGPLLKAKGREWRAIDAVNKPHLFPSAHQIRSIAKTRQERRHKKIDLPVGRHQSSASCLSADGGRLPLFHRSSVLSTLNRSAEKGARN